jgi:hypothetical protein
MRTSITSLVAMLSFLAVLPQAAAAPGGRNSSATISAAFTDSCRTFIAQSSKDISHVELRYADGRVVKDETIGVPDYEIEGGAGDELQSAIVKSAITSREFACVAASRPPVARLEIKTPAGNSLEGCFDFFEGGLMCEQSTPRVEWTSAAAVPDTGGATSGLFHWGCGFLTDRSLCSFVMSFRGIGSTDPDADITHWTLDFGDGTSMGGSWSTDPPIEVEHDYSSAYASAGSSGAWTPFVITLTVTDSAGQSSSESMKMAFVDVTPD